MRKMTFKNLTITLGLMLTSVFVGCNTEDVDFEKPSISVIPEIVNLPKTGGSETFEIKTNRPWKIEIEGLNPGEDSWLGVEPMTGDGDATITVTALNNPDVEKVLTLKVATTTVYQYVRVVQPGALTQNVLLRETVGTGASGNPGVDEWTEYLKEGLGAGTVTYTGAGVSVRTTNTSTDRYTGASGGNNFWLTTTAGSNLQVKNIGVGGATTLDISFGRRGGASPADDSWTNDLLKVYVVANNADIPVDYTFAAQTEWILASGQVTIPAGLSTVDLRFEATSVRLDDIKVTTPDDIAIQPVPVISTNPPVAGNISATSATLTGSFTYEGTDAITEKGISYRKTGTTTWTDVAQTPTRAEPVSISVVVTGLENNTEYEFAPYVKIGTDIYRGAENTFNTPKTWTAPTPVTAFDDDFSTITAADKIYTDNRWTFYSSSPDFIVNPAEGWRSGTYNTDKYLQVAPYNSTLATVTAYAMMTPFDMTAATDKSLSFSYTIFYQTADASKLELVKSTDFNGDFSSATWDLIENLTLEAIDANKNVWKDHTVDLSSLTGTVYLAFRYTGKANTYRLDNVRLGTLPTFEKTIADIRAMKPAEFSGTTTISDNLKFKGVVVSQKGTTTGQSIMLQDNTTANSGLTVRFKAAASNTFVIGDELEVIAKSATLTYYRGQLQLNIAADANITKTATANSPLAATPISVADLKTGNYESMYVSIANSQATSEFAGLPALNNSSNNGNIAMSVSGAATADYVMFTATGAEFKNDLVPAGNGALKGLGGVYADADGGNPVYQVQPQVAGDLAGLTGARPGDPAVFTVVNVKMEGDMMVGTAPTLTFSGDYYNAPGASQTFGITPPSVSTDPSVLNQNISTPAASGSFSQTYTDYAAWTPGTAGEYPFVIANAGIAGGSVSIQKTVVEAGAEPAYENGMLTSWVFAWDAATTITLPLTAMNEDGVTIPVADASMNLYGWSGAPSVSYTPGSAGGTSYRTIWNNSWHLGETPEDPSTKWWRFDIPLAKQIPAGKKITFSYAGYGTNGAPKNWVVEASTDSTNWTQVTANDYTTSRATFSGDYNVAAALNKNTTLYFRLRPGATSLAGNSINGTAIANNGNARVSDVLVTIGD